MAERDGYDLVDELNRAGVDLRIDGGRIVWRCDPNRPPVHGSLFLELAERKAEIIGILLDVPAGCPQQHVCGAIGICWREIARSECFYAEPSKSETVSDSSPQQEGKAA